MAASGGCFRSKDGYAREGAAQDNPSLADGLMVVEMMTRSSGKTGIFWVQLWPLMGPRGL